MPVRFILGRAGSGKTMTCLREIACLCQKEPLGEPLIFLVPDQATFEMEKELAALCGGGTFRAEILSFRRLAYRVLSLRGKRTPLITETGRQLVLRRILQEIAPELNTFGRAARQPRFCEQLAVQLRELKNYKLEPQSLQAAAKDPACPPALQMKLEDLAAIYTEYHNFVAGRYSDPEDLLTELAAAIVEGHLQPGIRVWVDGFAGFTPQELRVLAALMSSAAEVNVALCLDPANLVRPKEDELFQPTLDTYYRLKQIIHEQQIETLPSLVLPQAGQKTRFTPSAALTYLEANFADILAKPYPQEAQEIKLVTAAGSRAEVEAVARDILHLVREKKWRFRDIGIILRNFSQYHDLVTAVFIDYDIPYFIDDRPLASHHPLVEFLRSALEAAVTKLQQEPVLQMLKTDLFPLPRHLVDQFENYVRQYGIKGSRFLAQEPWHYHQRLTLEEGEEAENAFLNEINQVKNTFRDKFKKFYQKMSRQPQPAAEYCYALWQLLEEVNAVQTLQAWAEETESLGLVEQAQEHRQVWNGGVELLEQTEAILGTEKLPLQMFCEVVFTGLESLKLGLIPASLDCVTVGNVERSRQPRLRAVYVLGLNEGEFPARLQEEGLFADTERLSLAEAGMELAVTRRQRLFQEQYLSYIALTRSSEYLWLSCPLADDEGKAKLPSSLFNRVRELFPANEVKFFGNTPDPHKDPHAIVAPHRLAAQLLLIARRVQSGEQLSSFWAGVYQEALKHADVLAVMQTLWPALAYHNKVAPLGKENTEALFGRTLYSSVTRLEKFVQCPFAHFAQYGLRLRQKPEWRMEAPEMGVFFHEALCRFVRQLLAEKIEWSDLSVAGAQERMQKIVAELVQELDQEIFLSSARLGYLAQRLQEILAQAVTSLTLHAQNSRFAPVAAELSFGRGEVPAWKPAAKDKHVYLSGQIDRIDVARCEEKTYACIIDYKSSPTKLDLSDVWHGLSLQLFAYVAALNEYKAELGLPEAVSAGAFYFAIYRPFERINNPLPVGKNDTPVKLEGYFLAEPELLEALGGEKFVPAALKKDGSFTKYSRVVSREEFSALLAYVEEKIMELAEQIQKGIIDISPYKKPDGRSACTYCPYHALCCFEPVVPGNSYRVLQKLTAETVLAALLEEGGKENDE